MVLGGRQQAFTWAGFVHVGDVDSSFRVASTELALRSTYIHQMKTGKLEGAYNNSDFWIPVEVADINLSLSESLSELGSGELNTHFDSAASTEWGAQAPGRGG